MFAISTTEVSVEQFQQFLREYNQTRLNAAGMKQYSPDPNGPWLTATWHLAAQYCNWLSKREGLSEDQWCYIPNEAGAFGEGMTIPANVLQRAGYRLPTEPEWEYACRAGTVTSRYFGNSPRSSNTMPDMRATARTMRGRLAACCPTISDCSICSGMPANGARTQIRIIDARRRASSAI